MGMNQWDNINIHGLGDERLRQELENVAWDSRPMYLTDENGRTHLSPNINDAYGSLNGKDWKTGKPFDASGYSPEMLSGGSPMARSSSSDVSIANPRDVLARQAVNQPSTSAAQQVTSQQIGDARRQMDGSARAQNIFRNFQQQQQPQQSSNPKPTNRQPQFPSQNMPMSLQYADLTKDPAGMQQKMSGVGNTIGNALRANSQAMTDAGVGPLAPYSEKNPGPYNYMGPAYLGGESADKLAQEKASMFPSMGGMGGGMGGGGMGYVPSYQDQEKYMQYMDNMDMMKRRHQQNGAEAFQQNTMRFPAYAGAFNTMLGGIFGGNRQQFPNIYSTNFGAGASTGAQQPAQPTSAATNNPQNGYLNSIFTRY